MKRFKMLLIIMLTFIFSITLFSGCNNSNKKTNDKKGAYIEEDYSMPDDMFNITDMKKLDNGKIGLIGMTGYKEDSFEMIKLKYYESKDEGRTWSEADINFPEKNEEKFISYENGILTKDGNFILNYCEFTSEEIEIENNKENSTSAKKTNEDSGDYNISKWIILDRAGNKTDIENSKDIGICKDVKLDDKENGYFLSYKTNKITKVNLKSGKIENTLSLDKEIDKFIVLKDSLIVNNEEETAKYNIETLEKEEKIETLSSNSSNFNYYNGEDNETMYLLGNKGIYNYKLGNEFLECLIDGSKSCFGDSDYNFVKFTAIKNNEFLAVFSNSENNKFCLKHYYFSNEGQVSKDNNITIYTLFKSSNLEQAAKKYEDKHPEVEIKVESPMDNELPENVTKEDLIKTLNTEIMAGKGPDIINLTELPVDAYMEKGLLEDISSVIDESNKDDLFTNIINFGDSSNKLYAIPLSFSIPIVLNSTSKDIQSISDLSNNIKQVKKENFQEIIAPIKADEVIYYFARSSFASLLNDNKSLNKKALKDFLTNVKNIYDESKDLHSEISLENHKKYEEIFGDDLGEGLYYSNQNTGCGSAFSENQSAINISYLARVYDINIMYSNMNDHMKLSSWNGMGEKRVEAGTLIGLLSNSKNKKIAKDFIKELLTEEYKEEASDRLSINKNILRSELNKCKEDNKEYEIDSEDIIGNVTKLKIAPLKDEEINEIMSLIENYNGWSIQNEIMNKIIDEMVDYVEGKASMEDTIANIEKKLKIYLAE